MSEGLRILIIEGNPADAGFIHEMLPQAGPLRFQVESVRKLSEALSASTATAGKSSSR